MPDGSASIEFTVPDSVTSWNVFVHAVTRDWKAGSVKKETKSVKELMVRPYVPRFLREGDRAELKIVVNNASDKEMSGRSRDRHPRPRHQRERAGRLRRRAGEGEPAVHGRRRPRGKRDGPPRRAEAGRPLRVQGDGRLRRHVGWRAAAGAAPARTRAPDAVAFRDAPRPRPAGADVRRSGEETTIRPGSTSRWS